MIATSYGEIKIVNTVILWISDYMSYITRINANAANVQFLE